MTKEYEFRILEEKKRGRKLAINAESAFSLLAQHEGFPDKGVVQLRDLQTGEMVTRRIRQGSLI